jgi:hypothetical protein
MFDEKNRVKKISCHCPFQLSDISDISLLLSHREWVTALCMFVPQCITMHFFTSKIIPQVEATVNLSGINTAVQALLILS